MKNEQNEKFQFEAVFDFPTLNCWLNKASCTSRLDGLLSKPNDTRDTDADDICLQTQY